MKICMYESTREHTRSTLCTQTVEDRNTHIQRKPHHIDTDSHTHMHIYTCIRENYLVWAARAHGDSLWDAGIDETALPV